MIDLLSVSGINVHTSLSVYITVIGKGMTYEVHNFFVITAVAMPNYQQTHHVIDR